MKYLVCGKNRKTGSIGIFEHFTHEVKANNPEQARDYARSDRYDEGFEHVHIKSVEQIP